MVNNSLYLTSGENATVGLDVQITVDCKQLINDIKDKGEPNPNITWTKDGIALTNDSIPNVTISEDKVIVIVTRIAYATGGQVGNDGNYTCEVCGGTAGCKNETSCLKVCGEIDLF